MTGSRVLTKNERLAAHLIVAAGMAMASSTLAQQSRLQHNPDHMTFQVAALHSRENEYRGQPLSFYLSQSHIESQRADAFRAIGSFGIEATPALPELVAGLRDPHAGNRAAAAWAISQISPPHDSPVVKALAQALSDSDPKVRSLAALALRQIGPGAVEAVPALTAALRDPVDFVRAPAADALGQIGPAARTAVGPLTDALQVRNEQVFVLRSIAYSLGDIGPDARSALPALHEALKMVRVVYAAQEAILKITGQPVPTYK